ncbi:MAG: histidinol dehydrogenase [Phycisphaerales bacterium]
MTLLKKVSPADVRERRAHPVDEGTLAEAREIVEAVRTGGVDAVRACAERFGELKPGESLVLGPDTMRSALDGLDGSTRGALERAASRIDAFARAQRDAVREMKIAIPGGEAGHSVLPVTDAGCYAPGGRYPLPSSVLMTAITARAAGCGRVVVASPGAHPVMLASASIAGADEFLRVGGAHAIASLAYGFEGLRACDVIAGPGNKWVTAAKQFVHGVVGIDMLAGPSELVVLADEHADPATVAADLLAQAEHDTDASAMLVTTHAGLVDAVERELAAQLATLETREVARVALGNGFACVCAGMDEAMGVVERIAPEHLELSCAEAEAVRARVRHAGMVFVGDATPEVAGDYGAGPNHTLPTGGTARYSAGLSVLDFLRVRSWLRIDDPAGASGVLHDTAALARVEGLAAHERSACRRLR